MLSIAKQSCQYVEGGIETTQEGRSKVETEHLLSIVQIGWSTGRFNRIDWLVGRFI